MASLVLIEAAELDTVELSFPALVFPDGGLEGSVTDGLYRLRRHDAFLSFSVDRCQPESDRPKGVKAARQNHGGSAPQGGNRYFSWAMQGWASLKSTAKGKKADGQANRDGTEEDESEWQEENRQQERKKESSGSGHANKKEQAAERHRRLRSGFFAFRRESTANGQSSLWGLNRLYRPLPVFVYDEGAYGYRTGTLQDRDQSLRLCRRGRLLSAEK
jgi:hypothetical protein